MAFKGADGKSLTMRSRRPHRCGYHEALFILLASHRDVAPWHKACLIVATHNDVDLRAKRRIWHERRGKGYHMWA